MGEEGREGKGGREGGGREGGGRQEGEGAGGRGRDMIELIINKNLLNLSDCEETSEHGTYNEGVLGLDVVSCPIHQVS